MVRFLRHFFKIVLLIGIFNIILPSNSFTQILKLGPQINVSVGGRVFDVEDIPEMNAYVIVGDFDSINGVARNNIALIDKTTYAVKNNAPFTPVGLNVDGIIRSVEYLITRNGYEIIIGGNFITINGSIHQGLAIINKNTGPVTPSSNFSLYYFDYATGYNNGVYDLATIGDTLLVGGDLEGIDLTTGTDNSCYEPGDINGYHFFALSPSNTAARYSVIPNSLTNTPATSVYSIDARGNAIEIATSGSVVQERDLNFIVNPIIDVFPGTNSHYYSSLMRLNDTTVAYTDRVGGAGVEIFSLYSTNSLPNNYPAPVSNWQIQSPTSNDINGYIEYNNDLIVLNYYNSVKNVVERFEFLGETSAGKVSLNKVGPEFSMLPIYSAVYPQDDTLNNFFIAENKLFLSTRAMTSMDGLPRKGMAIFCLEPLNPSPFTVYDTTICSGNTVTYTIPQADYATGYKWSYSGIGATYRIAGTAAVFQPLTGSVILSNTNANSIEIQFNPSTTSGILSVTPFATCNTTTDYLFADSISLNLSLATPPNISFVDDTLAYTCLSDSLNLIVQSTDSGATYQWEYNSSIISTNDSLLITLASNTIDSTYYYAYVTEPINGCQAVDSIFVYYDTLATPINLADIVSTPAVFDCNTSSLTVSSTTPNATFNWAIQSNPSNLIPGTFTIYDSDDSTDIILYATYNNSGCTAQQSYSIAVNDSTLPGTLVGYSNYGIIPQDTLNCFDPTLTLVCDIASGSGSAQWYISGALSGDTLNLTQADTVGVNAFNTKVYTFITTNTTNGCSDTINSTIMFDFDSPYVNAYTGPASLNCSDTNLYLIHSTSGGSVTEGWLDEFSSQTFNDSLLIDTVGDYYYEVTSTVNGCVAADTVTIIKTNELLLNLADDTLVCDGQTVNISALPINNLQNTSYSWSNGDTTQTISAIAGIDSLLSVIAVNDSGCIGYDTISLLIPPPIIATFSVTAGCSNGNIQVTSVSGGTGSYEYSLDQITWQLTPSFANLSFGSYTVYIKDGIGCIFSFNETISSSSNSLAVNFLASTYNLEDDTVAIVNISDFSGFDSLVWILPDSGIVYSYDDSMVIMSVAAGGWYDITLIGYQDTCAYSLTKPVYFGALSPLFDTNNNAVGIQNYVVYPNPTNGNFTVDLTFGVAQNYSILVTNMQGQPISGMVANGVGDIISESFTFPGGLPSGTYVLHIIGDFDAEQTTIILN